MRTGVPGKDGMMEHTPYGYRIEDGKAVINEDEAEQVRSLYAGYLLGLSLKAAADFAGIKASHCHAKHIMQNRRYLGNGFYPQLIDEETFNAAREERLRREKILGRDELPKKEKPVPRILTEFTIGKITKQYANAVRQAEYAYGKIKEAKQ